MLEIKKIQRLKPHIPHIIFIQSRRANMKFGIPFSFKGFHRHALLSTNKISYLILFLQQLSKSKHAYQQLQFKKIYAISKYTFFSILKSYLEYYFIDCRC